jgi:methionyl-tRNA formyltransferase
MGKIILAGDDLGLKSLYCGIIECFKNIKIFTNTPNAINKRTEDSFIENLESQDYSIVLCSNYKQLIPCKLLKKHKFLNIHPSLLPKYRGMHSVVWAILNDEKYLGWTLHEMDEFIDSGNLIYQYSICNDFISTSQDYLNIFHKSITENIGKIVTNYIEGNLNSEPQDQSKASWVPKRNLSDCQIDFNFDINQIKNFFRALVPPYPVPFFSHKHRKYFIIKYKIHPHDLKNITCGRICNIDNNGLYISMKDCYLNISKVIDEDGKEAVLRDHFVIGCRLSKNN